MRMLIVGGATETAAIPGISAAGASPSLRAHTPSADFEIVTYGSPIRAPVLPISPSGCPTPAVVTRAVRDLVSLECHCIDAGLAAPTAAPTIDLGDLTGTDDETRWSPKPGNDIRDAVAVPKAPRYVEAGKRLGGQLPDDEIMIAETIPGGTTTALSVLAALGEAETVSSSLRKNPLARKREVVASALAAGDVETGDLAGQAVEAVRLVGDPVLATVAGLMVGASEAGIEVTLAGGTQLAAGAALARHGGLGATLGLATTSFLERDQSADIAGLAADLDLDLQVTDPEFDRQDHPATNGFVAGEGKEGVGMGGALAIAADQGVSMAAVRDRVRSRYESITAQEPAVKP